MRLACCRHEDTVRVGCVREENLVLLPPEFHDVVDVIEAGAAARRLADELLGRRGAESVAIADTLLCSPVRRFRRDVLCTGWNYREHFAEGVGGVPRGPEAVGPTAPTFFGKSPLALTGPFDDIAFDPRISRQWDYEAELALIIGRGGRNVPAQRARDHIWGYCLANDVSMRDLQRQHGGQWLKGKSIDGTTPLGPWVVTADAIEPQDIRLQCLVNGELRQDCSTRQMVFPIETLIAELSFGMTLLSGDVVLTGTPAGVGNARQPPVFLRAGDEMIVRGEGLGQLCNRLVQVADAGTI